MSAIRNIAIVAAVAAVGYFVSETVLNTGAVDDFVAMNIDHILDENIPGNGLMVSSVDAPIVMAVPFLTNLANAGIVSKTFEGFFTVARKSGATAPACAAVGVPYTARLVAGGKLGVEVKTEDAMRLAACL